MNTNSIDFKIQDALDALGIKDINLGTSTGQIVLLMAPILIVFHL